MQKIFYLALLLFMLWCLLGCRNDVHPSTAGAATVDADKVRQIIKAEREEERLLKSLERSQVSMAGRALDMVYLHLEDGSTLWFEIKDGRIVLDRRSKWLAK